MCEGSMGENVPWRQGVNQPRLPSYVPFSFTKAKESGCLVQPLGMEWWLISNMAESGGLLLCKCIIDTRKGGRENV